MPGILGILTDQPEGILGRQITAGLDRLLRQPWHHSRSCVVSRFGVGVALLGGQNEGGDLWCSGTQDLVVAVDGELYNGPPLKDCTMGGIEAPTHRTAEYVGALWRERGAEWVEAVRGAFAVAIWDRTEDALWLFSDRFGLRPLYHATVKGGFIFGSSMAAVTKAWPNQEWRLNHEAVADYFTFEHVLGEKSYVEGLHLLANAERVQYQMSTGETKAELYWCLDKLRPHQQIRFPEAVEEACRLFESAMDEQTTKDGRPGVYLTSGLDSRTIAGYLKRISPEFFSCTYGLSGCRDLVWGTELARILGSRHASFVLDDGSWIIEHGPTFILPTEGFVNFFHCHGQNTYLFSRDLMDYHLSGIGGGSFAGGDTTSHTALSAATDKEQVEEIYKHYRFALGNVFRTNMEQDFLFQPAFRVDLRGRAEASLRGEFAKVTKLRPDLIGDAFTLSNRYKKQFSYLIASERDYFENRCPFLDYRFLDFIFSIPTNQRLNRRLQIGMVCHAFPRLARVPWQMTGVPLTLSPLLSFLYRIERLIKVRLVPGYSHPTEPGRNYPKWLYESCLNWVSEQLDNDRLQSRGVLDRTYLRDLIARIPGAMKHRGYQDQRNLAYRLGAALAFELMCRLVFDGES